jgi:magnesium transporter
MTMDSQQLYDTVEAALRLDDPAAFSDVLSGIHAADLAEIYDLLADEDRSRLIYALPASKAAEVIVLLDQAERNEAVEEMDEAELVKLTSEMEPDDAADVLGELSEKQRGDVLEELPDDQADKIEELLTYDEDTAGGIMTKNLVVLPADATVGQAIKEIRTSFPEEDLHYIYVVDRDGRFAGMVPLRQLVLNDKECRLRTVCIPDPVTVRVRDDQEVVAQLISKYDCVAVPVLDDDEHLLGRITHDDIMDVFEEEADEDIYRMVGLEAAEFERASIVRAAGIRLSWLVPCLVSMAITAAVMMTSQGWFDELVVYAALVIFVPMIAAIGGNCGIQIATVIVRGLATGELASSKFRTAFVRESRIALIMAPVCSLVAWLICRLGLPFLHGGGRPARGAGNAQAASALGLDVDRIALAVGMGMACAILVAASLGMVLPFLFRRLRVDPAIASGPVVTTTNDIISVTIYLAFASLIMVL